MKYIIWDWNGTLLDDVPLCVEIMNTMLKKRGLPELELPYYREIFTFPVEKYYRAAGLDFTQEPFETLAVEYISAYNPRALGCGLYPGALKVLEQLKAAGWGQVIASASEQGALEKQVENCGIACYFQAILGVGDVLGITKEGLAKEYLASKAISAQDAIFIGDTLHDIQVAGSLGSPCALIAQGHQSRARLEACGAPVLESIRELPDFLGKSGIPLPQ